MKTLDDAWNWYVATKQNLERMRRLGEKHWNDPSLRQASFWQDDRFRMLLAEEIITGAEASLKPIEDLAIVVLFSVFESHVRDYLTELIRPEAEGIINPILKQAADDAISGIREGSFYLHVLEPLKDQHRISTDLITQVAQVRDYRNWVAHGRRGEPKNNVTPVEAKVRLEQFLAAVENSDEFEPISR